MVRVLDEKLDAKTFFYTGGDERNVVEGPPAGAARRAGVARRQVPGRGGEPAAESWYPGLKAFVRHEETEKREAACSAMADGLTKAMLRGRTYPRSNLPKPNTSPRGRT